MNSFDTLLSIHILSEMPQYNFTHSIACVASVSVRFRSKERGTRVKDRGKMARVKERGGDREEMKETLADQPHDFENRPLGLSCLSSRTDI